MKFKIDVNKIFMCIFLYVSILSIWGIITVGSISISNHNKWEAVDYYLDNHVEDETYNSLRGQGNFWFNTASFFLDSFYYFAIILAIFFILFYVFDWKSAVVYLKW